MMKTTLIGKVVTVSYWHEIYKPDEGTTRKTLKDITGVLAVSYTHLRAHET